MSKTFGFSKRGLASVFFVLTLPVTVAPSAAQNMPSGARNVLIIIADDYGIDASRQYRNLNGSSLAALPATPTIQRLANSGVTFDNAWANPVCSPTRAGLYTGRHGFRTGVMNALPSGPALPTAEISSAELIGARGDYASGIFGKWHLGEVNPLTPNDQGFDRHSGSLLGSVAGYDLWTKVEDGVSTPNVTTYPTLDNVDDAISWIQAQETVGKQWLTVVAFNAPHTPLHTPLNTCDGVASAVDDYDLMVECLDLHVGRLLTELSTEEVLEETTIIFFGDNGTPQANLRPPFDSSPNPSHKTNVYEGGIRVPMIVADGYHLELGLPGPVSTGVGRVVSPGRREDAMVHSVDVFATVADIVGASSTAEDSISMVPYLSSASATHQRLHNYTDRCTSTLFQAAIRNEDYKLVYRLDYSATPVTHIYELYAVSDLSEATDLFLTGIGAEAELWTALNELWASEGFFPLGGCP